MMKKRPMVPTALVALSVFGCGGPSYSTHEISGVISPTGGSLSLAKVTVPLGGAIKAHIVAFNTDRERMGGGVSSGNAAILGVANVVTSSDDWIFFGATPGTTVVHLQADGATVREVQAEVIDVQDVSSSEL